MTTTSNNKYAATTTPGTTLTRADPAARWQISPSGVPSKSSGSRLSRHSENITLPGKEAPAVGRANPQVVIPTDQGSIRTPSCDDVINTGVLPPREEDADEGQNSSSCRHLSMVRWCRGKGPQQMVSWAKRRFLYRGRHMFHNREDKGKRRFIGVLKQEWNSFQNDNVEVRENNAKTVSLALSHALSHAPKGEYPDQPILHAC